MDQNLILSGKSYQGVKPASEIFVVDDDKEMRDILATALAPSGFPVTTFEDGDSFLTTARTRVPICVFLDVVMPRRSGLEILKELRALRYWTPTFLTSARDDIPTVVEAIKNGAHDYIRKPFDPDALGQRVRIAVDAWLHREDRRASDFQANENYEWFRLSPSERSALLLMRLMNTQQ
jgi:two-component system response regulator FixJ